MRRFQIKLGLLVALPLAAQTPGDKLFIEKVQPVFSANCYGCHSSRLSSPKSGLILDTKAGLQKGGDLGQDVVPGKPDESRLLRALRYNDPNLQMPPTGKLPDSAIAVVEQWILAGAPDPRKDALPTSTLVAASSAGAELFEKKIRPVLVAKCFACHSSTLKAPMGGLALDTNAGLRKGGESGPVMVAGNPAESRLVQALKYTNQHLQMPPTGKLSDSVIADFEEWVAAGAPDPRKDIVISSAPGPLRGMSVEDGRKWWAFQPVRELPEPKVKDAVWARTKIDSFLLAKMEQSNVKPSPAADRKTLIERAYIDLIGIKPTYEQIEAFEKDNSPDAYSKLIDGLLASPHYGERWGRHWLDVARFAEDNPTSEATNPPYPFAWRYRDWVIKAVNEDVPYDRFVKLQLAADLMPDTKRVDMEALGYLGAAPVYHKEPRLSQEVLYGFATDDWDERVDAVGRGVLGLTVGCARCHDHKFDPIKQSDYYGLAGVFASTMRAERPLRTDIDPKTEARYLWVEQRLFDLNVITGILANEDKETNPEWAARKLAEMNLEMKALQAEIQPLREKYPELVAHVASYTGERKATPAAPDAPVNAGVKADKGRPSAAAKTDANAGAAAGVRRRRREIASEDPFMDAVYDAALYVDGKDPFMTEMDYRPGEARDLPVFKGGSVANPGAIVPRHFPLVLSESADESRFTDQGSGRLQLAQRIFTDSAPLAARVFVNRVWAWHFGEGLVDTPSDFGTQGDKPTHPELLDDLAARFIAQGWSLKWLNREIMLSAAYQQSSRPRKDAEQVDAVNHLVWRMNPRRLDVETYRDSILSAAGTLNPTLYGPSTDLDDDRNNRRTIYATVSRGRMNSLLREYDFPDPMQTSPGREVTTTPLQQLFVMNSPFIQHQAEALAKGAEAEPDNRAKVTNLFRKILLRDPSPKEIDLAQSYLAQATLSDYAQALLSLNEVIFCQ
jgi:mono/diheme cytochrome c family protein